MIAELETFVLSTAQAVYDTWGWLGVALLLVFENATGITPSEIILGLAGWMLISEHQLPPSMIFLGGLYAALGSVIGASITYWVARLGGRPLVDKLARWVHLDAAHIDRAEAQFHRWGTGLVLVGRVMPGIRTIISIPAGLARMPFIIFFVATFIGAYVWCTLLIGAGYILGHEWMYLSTYVKQFFPYLLASGVAVLAVYFWFTHRAMKLAAIPIRVEEE
jgi:membrane protein DedA with SNARE-associated domain